MSKRRPTKNERVDIKFSDTLKKKMLIRVNKGLAKQTSSGMSIAEATRLLQNTQGWKNSLYELENKPKRRRT